MLKTAEAIKEDEAVYIEKNSPARKGAVKGLKPKAGIKSYSVWDLTVRLFHWVNVACVMALMAVGIVILNDKSLGITTEGKILLKTVHVYIGYVFALNLGWRVIWGFIGGKHAKWKQILPLGKKYRDYLAAFIKGEKTHNPPNFLGHNPIARIMVTLLFVLLGTQAVTGLFLAGSDVYMPPFGNQIATWVAADESRIAEIKPYSKVNVDPVSYKEMRALRKPFIKTHVFAFYVLLAAILFHIAGVVYSEMKEKSGLVSAMITGKKHFSKKPIDFGDDESES